MIADKIRIHLPDAAACYTYLTDSGIECSGHEGETEMLVDNGTIFGKLRQRTQTGDKLAAQKICLFIWLVPILFLLLNKSTFLVDAQRDFLKYRIQLSPLDRFQKIILHTVL